MFLSQEFLYQHAIRYLYGLFNTATSSSTRPASFHFRSSYSWASFGARPRYTHDWRRLVAVVCVNAVNPFRLLRRRIVAACRTPSHTEAGVSSLDVGVLHPDNIWGHVRMGSDFWECFIVLPYGETRTPASWPDIPLNHNILTLSQLVLCPVLIMANTWKWHRKWQVWMFKSLIWIDQSRVRTCKIKSPNLPKPETDVQLI